jgi:hypothetical protein
MKKEKHWAKFIIVFLAMIIIDFDIGKIAYADDVEIDVGPKFGGNDIQTVGDCVTSYYGEKFPLDLFKEIPPSTLTCPTIELFGFTKELCEITEIWGNIRPGLFIVLLYQGVINL